MYSSLRLVVLFAIFHFSTSVPGAQSEPFAEILVELKSAHLLGNAGAPYATVCIISGLAYHPLPLKYHTICDFTASTPITENSTNNPIWNFKTKSGMFKFNDRTRIIVEVWNHHGVGNKEFLAGTTFTIPQLMEKNNNGKEIHQELVGPKMKGQLNMVVNWLK